MSERKVFTYKDVEEAKKYIGKTGVFSNNLFAIENGYGANGVLEPSCGPEYIFGRVGATGVYQFFSPDPEPVEKWVRFTAEDHELFKGKWIVEKNGPNRHMIVHYDEFGVALVGPGFGTTYQKLLDQYTFLDGTTCGKKVTE